MLPAACATTNRSRRLSGRFGILPAAWLVPQNSRSQGPSHPPPVERPGIAGRTSAEAHAPTFTVTTQSNPLQRRALDLIDQLVV